MIKDGLFNRFPMESIYGYHNWPGLEAGTVMVHEGPVMAGGGRVEITMEGLAGHAALPHLTRDPMLAAGHLLVALQSIVARNVDPLDTAVVTIGTIEGGRASNQIPSKVTMRGTQRFYRDEVRDLLTESITRVANGIAATVGMRTTTPTTSTTPSCPTPRASWPGSPSGLCAADAPILAPIGPASIAPAPGSWPGTRSGVGAGHGRGRPARPGHRRRHPRDARLR